MAKQKNKPMWALFWILLTVFLIGLAAETVLKYIEIRGTMRPEDPAYVLGNRLMRAFGDESVPIWSVPTALNWMLLIPRDPAQFALRWIPYLVAFLLPVFCALLPKRAIPLILCAIGAGFVGVGLAIEPLLASRPYSNLYAAIPFGIECLLLILACIALGAKKKGFAIALGVCAVLLALLSPAVSALLAGMSIGGGLPDGYPIRSYCFTQLRRLPLSAAVSQWPIHKTFAFVLYALILFTAPKRFPKR